MREVTGAALESEAQTFRGCVATILELALDAVPDLAGEEDVAGDGLRRWLGGLGLGLVPVADAAAFAWSGPWIARVSPAGDRVSPGSDRVSPANRVSAAGATARRAVVMFGTPSGVAWDPSGATAQDGWRFEDGFVIAALDIALAPPPRPAAPAAQGSVEAISLAPTAGAPAQPVEEARALAGLGLEGDRHVAGKGTFPSGLPGTALTLIEAEVCDSFTPPLAAGEHRRNIVTRGIDLNSLVGHEFAIGAVRCRGMRLCEPCTVVQRYAARPVLRPLVHRGGLRADILEDGVIRVGDLIEAG